MVLFSFKTQSTLLQKKKNWKNKGKECKIYLLYMRENILLQTHKILS